MRKGWKRKIPVVILLALAGTLAFSGIIMLLWNSILPAVLHVGVISIWQAAGILLLSKILFGGRKGMHGFGWRHRMRMKWENMNPEDRDRFRNHMNCRRDNYNREAAL